MLYCFLDTNIFHEFKPITEINWVRELGTSEVCLVVTSVVVQELDKHKGGNNNRLKKRAKKWTAFLEALDITIDNVIRQNVTLRLDLAEPKDGTFDEYNLSANVADDRLLAKALEFATQNKADEVAVVSEDSAVRLKARGHNLSAPTLSNDYREKYEPDPLVKKNQELQNELQRIQNRQPKLQFGILDEDEKIVRQLHAKVNFEENLISDSELNQEIEKERKRLKYPRRHRNSSTGIYAVDYDILGATQEQIDDYRDEVREFLEGTYRRFLYQNSLHRVFHISAIKLPLILENSGSLPARGIEIALKIRGARAVLSGEPALFGNPTSPVYPTVRIGSQMISNLGHSVKPDFRYNVVTVPGTESEMWSIADPDESSARVAQCYFNQLTHNKRRGLDELFLIVDKPDKFPLSVIIEIEVIAENLIDKVTDELKIIINEIES